MQESKNGPSSDEPVPPRSVRNTARTIAKATSSALLILSGVLAIPALVLIWNGSRSAHAVFLCYLGVFALFVLSTLIWLAMEVTFFHRVRFSLRTLMLVMLGLGACATVVVEFQNNLAPWGILLLYLVIVAAAFAAHAER
jgi:peptidoglycan/LPS O-acetylase OafA/YrhL